MNKYRRESETRIAALFAARAASLKLDIPPHIAADDARKLHGLAAGESRRAERGCNEDNGCRECGGYGYIDRDGDPRTPCKRCAGTGDLLGPASLRAAKRAREIASRYAMRLYEQGDPRGCPFYLIPESAIPTPQHVQAGDREWPSVNAWISSNYSSVGVAVHP